jgi:hypothetical protein
MHVDGVHGRVRAMRAVGGDVMHVDRAIEAE